MAGLLLCLSRNLEELNRQSLRTIIKIALLIFSRTVSSAKYASAQSSRSGWTSHRLVGETVESKFPVRIPREKSLYDMSSFEASIIPTTVIILSKFILTTDCFCRTPTFAIKFDIASTAFELITLLFLADGTDQSEIIDHCDPHSWT